jgi:hypothetical protein
MTNTYRVAGDLNDTNINLISEAFFSSAIEAKLEDEENLHIIGSGIKLRVYESITQGLSGNYDFLISGYMEGDFETVEKLLKEIASLLESRNIVYNFEFYEDCDGEPPEEYCIKHPDF